MSDNLKAAFIILMFLLFNSHSFIINAEQTPSPITISIFEDDLTGDKQHETIQLKGSLLHDNSSFYQNIWIEIKSIHSEKWKIPFTGGYDPHIQLLDLTQDQVNDLFYQSAQNKKDRKSTRLNSSHVSISYAVFCLKKNNAIDKIKSASCCAKADDPTIRCRWSSIGHNDVRSSRVRRVTY